MGNNQSIEAPKRTSQRLSKPKTGNHATSGLGPAQLEHRASWNYNLGSYEAQRLLNLAEEPGLDHETAKSENRLPMVTDAAWKSSNPAHIPSAPISRANSDLSLYMPVRRRSIIQTPGVATRSVSMRDLPPLPQPSFRLSHPPTPSLSRQHSVESYRSGIISMPPRIQDLDYAERVVTPRGDEYLSIGAFKLGSLRITNGSPSPLTPEVGRGRDGSETLRIGGAEDGYFPRAQRREPGDTASSATQGPVPPPKFLSEVSKSSSGLPTASKPTVPALQSTSKQIALENNYFEDEELPEYSLVEVLDVRLDPNAKPPHPQHEGNVGKSITRTDSGFVSTASPASEASYKPLSKADSGYSSNSRKRQVFDFDQFQIAAK
ncbi:hypothetical protein N0V88_003607 [Collariella sp. IMI 366227]|nr:hypothetical protein N0V88_003607 [Collariella sp. IMI 366227]